MSASQATPSTPESEKKIALDPEGNVLMTQSEIDSLMKQLGSEWFQEIYREMRDYALVSKKKWKSYSSHAAVMRQWARRKKAQGYVFFNHPVEGPGLYLYWVVDKFTGVKR